MRLTGIHLLTVPLVLLTVLLWTMSGFAMDDFPDQVEIDTLAHLYEPVVFNHATHVEMTEDCSVCHHHTTGSPPVDNYCLKCHSGDQELAVVACRDCHASPALAGAPERPQEFVFHDDQPNLKAAYHLNCMGCHREVGGPVGCEDCHTKTEAGNRFYHSGDFAPATAPAEGHSH